MSPSSTDYSVGLFLLSLKPQLAEKSKISKLLRAAYNKIDDITDYLENILDLSEKDMNGKPVYKVAVCGGSGTDFIAEALKAGADTFVTGDVKYHVAQEALNAGINLIDAGHQTSEMPVLIKLQKELEDWASSNNRAIKVFRAFESKVLQHL